MQVYNKLVRDKIPDRILAKGEECISHVATEEEYVQKLQEKFLEEWEEYNKSTSADELADILEVIEALGNLHGESFDDLMKRKERKREERGGFEKRIILDQS